MRMNIDDLWEASIYKERIENAETTDSKCPEDLQALVREVYVQGCLDVVKEIKKIMPVGLFSLQDGKNLKETVRTLEGPYRYDFESGESLGNHLRNLLTPYCNLIELCKNRDFDYISDKIISSCKKNLEELISFSEDKKMELHNWRE